MLVALSSSVRKEIVSRFALLIVVGIVVSAAVLVVWYASVVTMEVLGALEALGRSVGGIGDFELRASSSSSPV